MTDQVTEPAFKKRAGYHGALLAGFSTLAATLLVMGDLSTRDTIELRLAEDLQASLAQVIPATIHDNNLLDNKIIIPYRDKSIVVYQGVRDGEATAVAFSVSGQGYAGEIKLLMGLTPSGEVLGVRVLSHAETPGLGDKIEEAKDDWIFRFDGLSFKKLTKDKWAVKKDGGEFDQFSGATITPRAVVKAIKEGLSLFHSQQNKFLKINHIETDSLIVTNIEDTKPDIEEGANHE